MKQADNDNTDTWISLAAATANAVRFLTKEKNPPQNDNQRRDNGGAKHPEAKPDAQREYVDQRLRELAAWERRIGGKNN